MTHAERDAYAVLQVHPEADHEVLRAAYRALAKRYHPEGSTPDPRRMAEINHAYDQVRTPERRAAFDRERLVPVGPGRAPVAAGPPGGGAPSAGPPSAGPLARRAETERGLAQRVDFGRYEGWTIAALARHDPDYLRWLSRHSMGIRYQKAIEQALPGDRHVGRRPRVLR